MENLLSLAFDNLSSWDKPAVSKGLRQVDSLLANICLQRQQTSRGRRASVAKDPGQEQESPPIKTLSELAGDPAFYEFFKLQEGFQWNISLRLVGALDRLVARNADGGNDLLIMSMLDTIQGVLHLHPPSKALFSREQYMELLLGLLEPDCCPGIHSAALFTLVTALIDTPLNTRMFEKLDGLLTVTSLLRDEETTRSIKARLVEFLYFYLMPETPSIPSAAARDSLPGLLPEQRSPSKLARAFAGNSKGGRSRSDSEYDTRSQEEKQYMLSRHLHSVEDLVNDLRHNPPFGGALK